MQAPLHRHFARIAAAALLLGLAGCELDHQPGPSLAIPHRSAEESAAPLAPPGPMPEGTLTAYFFDVGQGDCAALIGPDFTIVVDAGRHDRKDVVPHLRAAGVETISLLVGTHPHADHIGQFDQVIGAFPVEEIWMSGDKHTSRTFERALDAALNSDAGYHEPRAGEAFHVGSARVEVIHPKTLTGDLNHGSIAVRIVYGNVAFLLPGDAEKEAELEMLDRGHPLTAQILKLGHHGSSTSSTEPFLRAVGPEAAVYSAGAGNSYGHPHSEVVDRLAAMAVDVYGTDRHGTIQVVTDGTTFHVRTERTD